MGELEIFVYRRSIDKFESYGYFDRILTFLNDVVRKRMWSAASYDCLAIAEKGVLIFEISLEKDTATQVISNRVYFPSSAMDQITSLWGNRNKMDLVNKDPIN